MNDPCEGMMQTASGNRAHFIDGFQIAFHQQICKRCSSRHEILLSNENTMLNNASQKKFSAYAMLVSQFVHLKKKWERNALTILWQFHLYAMIGERKASFCERTTVTIIYYIEQADTKIISLYLTTILIFNYDENFARTILWETM